MVKRNPNLSRLQSGYLFPEIAKHKNALLEKQPQADIISLGIGDTTKPISPSISSTLSKAGEELGTKEGYSGYGPGDGVQELREKISEKIYNGKVDPDEIFISDGAKCDIGRLQVLFGNDSSVAVQDPSYPAYVDTSVIIGQTKEYSSAENGYSGITYMSCTPENHFFPDLEKTARTDIIFFCSPNNPTGAVATKEQLADLIAFAKKNHSIIVFDAAYSEYIQDPTLPKSIYDVEGGDKVAIEVHSFSKTAGFTGVRLGWSVVPKKLNYEDGSSVHSDWQRICSTFFNGASNIAQIGGIAALEDEGIKETKALVASYLNNALRLKKAVEALGFKCYGGDNAPYIWIHFPEKKSWEIFKEILEKAHIVTTPGAGFGSSGEHFIRISAFGTKEDVGRAIVRLEKMFKAKS